MSNPKAKDSFALTRRSFLKTFGASAGVAATAQVEAVAAELAKANSEKVYGPGTVPITLHVNGKPLKLELEPRVTLLDALRRPRQKRQINTGSAGVYREGRLNVRLLHTRLCDERHGIAEKESASHRSPSEEGLFGESLPLRDLSSRHASSIESGGRSNQ